MPQLSSGGPHLLQSQFTCFYGLTPPRKPRMGMWLKSSQSERCIPLATIISAKMGAWPNQSQWFEISGFFAGTVEREGHLSTLFLLGLLIKRKRWPMRCWRLLCRLENEVNPKASKTKKLCCWCRLRLAEIQPFPKTALLLVFSVRLVNKVFICFLLQPVKWGFCRLQPRVLTKTGIVHK